MHTPFYLLRNATALTSPVYALKLDESYDLLAETG